jgi:hypothetical protein
MKRSSMMRVQAYYRKWTPCKIKRCIEAEIRRLGRIYGGDSIDWLVTQRQRCNHWNRWLTTCADDAYIIDTELSIMREAR